MRRKRLTFPDQVGREVTHQNGTLSPVGKSEDAYTSRPYITDLMDDVPTSAALSLGRPEGTCMSLDQQDQLQTVQQAFDNGILDQLSTMQRNCFTDVIISGDSYLDVAKRYGITVGSVQTHVRRAAKRIRKSIGNWDE